MAATHPELATHQAQESVGASVRGGQARTSYQPPRAGRAWTGGLASG